MQGRMYVRVICVFLNISNLSTAVIRENMESIKYTQLLLLLDYSVLSEPKFT